MGAARRRLGGAADAIEELIRYDPPLQLFERWVLEDGVEVAGTPIPRGEKISMLFGSANRDPRVFASPDDFDVAGRTRPSTSASAAASTCASARRSRASSWRRACARLVERCPQLELAAEPVTQPGLRDLGLRTRRASD